MFLIISRFYGIPSLYSEQAWQSHATDGTNKECHYEQSAAISYNE